MNKSDELSGTFDAISKANFTGRNVSDVEEVKIPSHYKSKCLKWFTTYLTKLSCENSEQRERWINLKAAK